MAGFLNNLIDPSGFTPHGFCLAWDPALIWLQGISDLLIALCYFSIPLALGVFARKRRDLAFRWIFGLFALFITGCGVTHVMAVLTLWVPAYWTEALFKVGTALVSCVTAILLWQLIPRALALPSPQQLRRANALLDEQVRQRDAVARQLAESEARHRALFMRAPVAMHTISSDGRVIAVTDHWLTLLGYRREEVIGEPITRFQDAETADVTRAAWPGVRNMGTMHGLPRRFVRRSGEVMEVLVSFTVEHEPDGSDWHIISSITDVTARRQAEAALRASEERVRQAEKLEAVGQLTGGIAHDFNNMLTVVMGSMELLGRRVADDERATRLVKSALDGAGKAASLTRQLLAFSRRQRLEPQALEAVQVATGMEALLKQSAGEQIRLEIEPAPAGLWWCLADRNQLEAALLNLVLNARAAIQASGRVTIGCRNLSIGAREAAETAELEPGEYVSVTVKDTGSGMTEEVWRRAFEPFFTTKQAGQGSGLGLAQIYGFARQSGGIARIRSTPGMGTQVELLLPRTVPPRTAMLTPGSMTGLPAGRGERILVAEDEPTVRELIAAALRDCGYEVTEAADADEALERFEAEAPFDLLFTDIVMPGERNGVDLALEIRRQQPGLPVLFATGYSDRSVLTRWPGPINLLDKPYTLEMLVNRLRQYLDVGPAPSVPAAAARVPAQ